MKERKLYTKYNTGEHWKNHSTTYAKTFLDFLKEKKFSGILFDLGCGNGRDVNFFKNHNLNAKGIDLNDKYISEAKVNFPNLCFEIQDIENLNFDDNSIDAFYMINVIHYLDEKKSLNEVFRKLKHGGYLFIHFNLEIKDNEGNMDYSKKEEEIYSLISKFYIIKKKIFKRVDTEPVNHTHKIIELILQKP